MGSGKTSAAINLMNQDTEHNYIFITPYLSEVERIKKSCSDRRFFEPKIKSVNGELHGKFDSLHDLLKWNKNIASTHALFRRSNEETRELIHAGNYVLILDEVMDVVEQFEMKKSDMKMLFEYGLLSIEDNYIVWNDDNPQAKEYDGVFNDLKQMALNKNLIFYRDTILIWTFPVDIFKSFKEVYILTYLFDAQIQRYYYDLNGIQFEKYIAANESDSYIFKKNVDHSDRLLKAELKNKIKIYDGNLNDIGAIDYSLSKSWYRKRREALTKLKKNTENYFKHKTKTTSQQNMWTTYDDFFSKIKGNGYTKGYVVCNSRATNEHRSKTNLAYLVNRFVNPIIYGFFEEKGIRINQEMYAVSELLQWVWRSAIRDGEEVSLYLPSKRMRNLFIQWLEDEIK
ncbi:hypothetical protein [Brevibacillus brevis]|uniref:hypothetical protein n=1 Tax=Brevibacillus brevis TaxID=1393 RepID=UPI0007D8C61D|nr:hypothetical protein [Brevibacillus brevis]